jgi:hypothetical protein
MALRPVIKSQAILNHVLNLQRFSLANYLRYARPWAGGPDHILLKVVFGIAQVQRENATRVGELLVQRHASAAPGIFLMSFTGLNDLSVRHVAPRVVEDLERIIHELRLCAEALRDDDLAREIVEAILHDEERHLRILCDEIRRVEKTVLTQRQLDYALNRDRDPAKDAARQRSSANVTEVPQPA